MNNKQNMFKRTPVNFVVLDSVYFPGIGPVTTRDFIEMTVGYNSQGDPINTNIFYVEWIDSYGSQAIMLQQQNIIRPARVRMTYVKEVYEALKSKEVHIYLNCDANDCFMLNSSVSNNLQENQILEFQVKRFEVK